MIDEIKNQLRLKYKDLRKGMQDSLKQQYDQQIFNNLLKFQDFQQADTVLTYMSTKMEIDTHQIIEYSLNNKKKIALPKCMNNNMNFYYYDKTTLLRKSKNGILEPYGTENDIVDLSENIICIVPGLTFDLNGYRLGYGGGYYDRFLCENNILITVGLCYQNNLTDKLIINQYDMPVNYIITENSLEVCNGKK